MLDAGCCDEPKRPFDECVSDSGKLRFVINAEQTKGHARFNVNVMQPRNAIREGEIEYKFKVSFAFHVNRKPLNPDVC